MQSTGTIILMGAPCTIPSARIVCLLKNQPVIARYAEIKLTKNLKRQRAVSHRAKADTYTIKKRGFIKYFMLASIANRYLQYLLFVHL